MPLAAEFSCNDSFVFNNCQLQSTCLGSYKGLLNTLALQRIGIRPFMFALQHLIVSKNALINFEKGKQNKLKAFDKNLGHLSDHQLDYGQNWMEKVFAETVFSTVFSIIFGMRIQTAKMVQRQRSRSEKRVKSPQRSLISRRSPSKKNLYEAIPLIPQLRLTKEQMLGDPISLLENIEPHYKQYGAVKLVACPQWRPPNCFRLSDSEMTTRIQPIHKLQRGKVRQLQRNQITFILHSLKHAQLQPFDQNIDGHNVRSFTLQAEQFEKTYSPKFPVVGSTSQAQNEREYWSLVNCEPLNGKIQKVTVQYAADLSTVKHGSGFPLYSSGHTHDEHFNYQTSLFNLNNLFRSPRSVLSIADRRKQYISGVTVPWIYMGMKFSSFCWHVEDLWVNSINYNHEGGVKTWYIIPQSSKERFDQIVTEKFGNSHKLGQITLMIDPLELMAKGVKVYKTYQRPHEFVCTFFKAYHCGFSQSLNLGEAVNFISANSIPVIEQAMLVNTQLKKKKVDLLSLDWLFHENVVSKSHATNSYIKQRLCQVLADQERVIKGAKLKGIISKVEIVPTTTKFDKFHCYVCKSYQYLHAFRCNLCSKVHCGKHLTGCCSGKYNLFLRDPQGDRKKTIQRALSKSKQKKE